MDSISIASCRRTSLPPVTGRPQRHGWTPQDVYQMWKPPGEGGAQSKAENF